MNNPSKSQYLFKFYVFNKTPCICHNQGRITSGRDFDLGEGVAISFEKCIFFFFFFYIIAQLSFKTSWYLLLERRSPHEARRPANLATFVSDVSQLASKIITTCVIWATVYNSLHKKTDVPPVIIKTHVLYLHTTHRLLTVEACEVRTWREQRQCFPHGGVCSLCVLSHPYWVTLYILMTVLCTVFKLVATV